MRTIEAVKLTV